jgi:molybdopterin molybdotransferase
LEDKTITPNNHFVSVSTADDIITKLNIRYPSVSIPITTAYGRVLRENLVADRDFPPFNRVAMDGIAINLETYNTGQRQFLIENEQKPGQKACVLSNKANTIEVMTGAILPKNTNCVIKKEDCSFIAENQVIINDNLILNNMTNIHQQGVDCSSNTTLLHQGCQLSGPEIAIAATIGKDHLQCTKSIKIAIISTGDELVPVNNIPEPYQIRLSNLLSIESSLKIHFPDTIISTMHFKDDQVIINDGVKNAVENNDIIIFSGGISVGNYDFTKEALLLAGFNEQFYKIKQRPGKPMWLGKSKTNKLAFALPGNPVSVITCLHRYVIPFINCAIGLENIEKSYSNEEASLDTDIDFKKDLTYFLPIKLKNKSAKLIAYPVKLNGSGDMVGLSQSDGFIELPAELSTFKKGETYPVYRWKT